ncbi:MAG: hypothetical protein JST21_12490 [Bacteroidetes bacterium]|nr:hypothetical protein [Bacteroidota bacterium]
MNLNQSIPLCFDYEEKHYEGEAYPSTPECADCTAYDVYLQDEFAGTIIKTNSKWLSDSHLDRGLLATIGGVIIAMLVTI